MPCPVCGTSFMHLKRRNEHVKFCGKTLTCDKCGKEFKTKQSLVGHHNAKHTEKFKCMTCKKCFESESKLARYNITHDKTNVIRCDKCSKTFNRRDNMLLHQTNKH